MIIQDANHQIDCSEGFVSRTLEEEEKDQIICWAEELVKTLNAKMPPVNVEELAIKVGIKEIRKANISVDGILLPARDGFVLTLNENQHPTRQRFTCAHEIAHTFFHPLHCSLRNAEHEEATRLKIGSSNLEHLCDIAAKHILMPDQMFRQAALRFGVSIEAINYLADIFQTSIPATALRFVEVSREPIILILSQIYEKPESSPKLRVRWSSQKRKTSSSSSYFIPPFVPIDKESKIHQAYKTEGICRGFDNFNIANLKGAYYTESKSFGSEDNKYVISLVFVEAQTKRLI
jgi:Zn-dependent peptidase ImmA (M78 family)